MRSRQDEIANYARAHFHRHLIHLPPERQKELRQQAGIEEFVSQTQTTNKNLKKIAKPRGGWVLAAVSLVIAAIVVHWIRAVPNPEKIAALPFEEPGEIVERQIYNLKFDSISQTARWLSFKVMLGDDSGSNKRECDPAFDCSTQLKLANLGKSYDLTALIPHRLISGYDEQNRKDARYYTTMTAFLKGARTSQLAKFDNEAEDRATRTDTWVIKGLIPGKHASIPEALFGLLLTLEKGRLKVDAYILPNSIDMGKTKLELPEYKRSLSDIENLTGLRFTEAIHQAAER